MGYDIMELSIFNYTADDARSSRYVLGSELADKAYKDVMKEIMRTADEIVCYGSSQKPVDHYVVPDWSVIPIQHDFNIHNKIVIPWLDDNEVKVVINKLKENGFKIYTNPVTGVSISWREK